MDVDELIKLKKQEIRNVKALQAGCPENDKAAEWALLLVEVDLYELEAQLRNQVVELN